MLECLILGDSIAVGVTKYRPECVAYAKGGWNSWQYRRDFGAKAADKPAETIIISLGSNDHPGVKTFDELYKMREKLQGKRVYWVLPNPVVYPKQSEEVKLIAIAFGDNVIQTKRYQTDKIHPSWAGYKELAEQAK